LKYFFSVISFSLNIECEMHLQIVPFLWWWVQIPAALNQFFFSIP
jgi:hypothetical protein